MQKIMKSYPKEERVMGRADEQTSAKNIVESCQKETEMGHEENKQD